MIPDKALYKCPHHGLFVVATSGVIWRERACPVLVPTFPPPTNQNTEIYPCGRLSPLAQINDPDIVNGPVFGLCAEELTTLRQTVAEIKELQKKEKDEAQETMLRRVEEKPTYMFGGAFPRRNGKPLDLLKADNSRGNPEREKWEAQERERMRAAIKEWTDESL